MTALILIILAVPLAFLDAWVFQVLWGWFIVPGFSVAPIPFVTALGISLLVGVCSPTPNPSNDEAVARVMWIICYRLISRPLALAFGGLYLLMFGVVG